MLVEKKVEVKEVEKVVKELVTTEVYQLTLTKQEALFMKDLFGELNWTKLDYNSPARKFISDVYNGLTNQGVSTCNREFGTERLSFENTAKVISTKI